MLTAFGTQGRQVDFLMVGPTAASSKSNGLQQRMSVLVAASLRLFQNHSPDAANGAKVVERIRSHLTDLL
ncbi:hypothetical protein ACVWZR_002605 [Bradyrhizobium sp. i1.3.1]